MSLSNLFVQALHPCEDATIHLCSVLNIRVTKSTLQKKLLEHPDYPSLLAISDVIKDIGVASVALKLDRKNLYQLNTPFIAVLHHKESSYDGFSVVKSITEVGITLYNTNVGKEEYYLFDEFDKIYKGIVLAVEADNDAGEKDFEQNVKKEKSKSIQNAMIIYALPAIVLIASIWTLLNSHDQFATSAFLFTMITFIGSVIGVFLLWYEIDQYNPVIKQICQAGEKINCASVLNSKGSKIFGISWSSIGSAYFIGMLLSLLMGGIVNPDILYLSSLANILALPYIIYSVYYQWRIVKQWCVLCLVAQAVLFLQFITALLGGFYTLSFGTMSIFQSFITLTTGFVLTFILILLIMPLLKKAKANTSKTIELQRLKHNPQIFEALLAKQKKVIDAENKLGIYIGSSEAKYKVIKVCNPYCGACSRAHPAIEDMLENNEDVQLQMIFNATERESDYRAKPVSLLMTIASENNESLTKQALNDWYLPEQKDWEVFASKYVGYIQPQLQSSSIKEMREWCTNNEIKFTPTYFINGHQLPELYTVNDLKYFLNQ